MSYTICSQFKGEHIVYAGYTICTSREHIVHGAFCGSTKQLGKDSNTNPDDRYSIGTRIYSLMLTQIAMHILNT